ncbi:hypothetical protein PMAYCL1PPCAC_06423, partial [Pristionchus mayeri]
SSIRAVVGAASAASMSSPPSLSLPLPLLPSSRPPRPSLHLPSRSHALCLSLLVLLFLSPSTTASPYYERDWNGADDDSTVFEADGSTGGSSSRPSDPPSLSIPRISPSTRTETTPDRQIRPETVSSMPTVLTPHFVSAPQPPPPPPPLPTILTLDQATSTVQPSISLELQNTRMMEIVANLTKKLGQGSSSGSDISISFTPDELKKMQEIIGATGQRLKADFETTRRELMMPSGGGKIPDLYNYDDSKQIVSPENPRFREEIDLIYSTQPPENNSTVIEESTLPPTEPIPDDLILTDPENPDQDSGENEQESTDGELIEVL